MRISDWSSDVCSSDLRVMEMPEGTRLYLLAPIVRGRKGEYRKELADLQKRGFQRVKIDGTLHEIDAAPALDKKREELMGRPVSSRLGVEGDGLYGGAEIGRAHV